MWYVYQLDSTNGLIYFGMTNNPKQRYRQHKCHHNSSMSRLLFEDDACVEMRILDEYVSKSVCEEREKYYIKKYVCVNARGRGRDMENRKAYLKKWNMENKERHTIVKNKWGRDNYDKFKDKKNSWKREKITCDNCGLSVSRNSMARHKRTAKCKNYTSAAALDC
jgi:predicted GIY-YIG superfamily endonuclease